MVWVLFGDGLVWLVGVGLEMWCGVVGVGVGVMVVGGVSSVGCLVGLGRLGRVFRLCCFFWLRVVVMFGVRW